MFLQQKYKRSEATEEWEKEEFLLKKASPQTGSSKLPIEYRGMTLLQLLAVQANVKKKCIREEWRDYGGNLLTPNKVTLYDVERDIIRPFTF